MTTFHWVLLETDDLRHGYSDDFAVAVAAVQKCVNAWKESPVRAGLHCNQQVSIPMLVERSAVTGANWLPPQVADVCVKCVGPDPIAKALRGRVFIGWVANRDLRIAADDTALTVKVGLTTIELFLLQQKQM